MSQRYFNTSGPNNVSDHYTLLRPALVRHGIDLVEKDRYFTIWAPRQTGKSTYFLLLKTALEENGYRVIYMTTEGYNNIDLPSFLGELSAELEGVSQQASKLSNFAQLSLFIKSLRDFKCVVMLKFT